MRREVTLTPLDVALLGYLARRPSQSEAARALRISTDRTAYRLRRLARALGTAVVVSDRGGAHRGRTDLTAAGRALLDAGPGAVVGPTQRRLEGEWVIARGRFVEAPEPAVDLDGGGPRLRVAFTAAPGERVRLAIDPAAILLATGRFASSARNVLEGRVLSVRHHGPGTGAGRTVTTLAVGAWRVPVAVTEASVAALGLRPSRKVYLYLKATAIRRDGPATRGSPRS